MAEGATVWRQGMPSCASRREWAAAAKVTAPNARARCQGLSAFLTVGRSVSLTLFCRIADARDQGISTDLELEATIVEPDGTDPIDRTADQPASGHHQRELLGLDELVPVVDGVGLLGHLQATILPAESPVEKPTSPLANVRNAATRRIASTKRLK